MVAVLAEGIEMDIKEQAAILDLTVRIFCLEKILIEKNLISKDELFKEFSEASDKLLRDLLKVANYQGDIEEAIKNFKLNKKENVN